MKDNIAPILIILFLFLIIGFGYNPLKNSTKNKSAQNIETTSAISNSSTVSNTKEKEKSLNSKEVAKSIKDAEKNIEQLEKEINKQIEKKERSPYYGKVSVSNISGLYSKEPDKEYMYLYTNLKPTETIKITGWYFKSKITGYFAKIPKASLLPFPFTDSATDVILTQKDKVIITKGFSPIGISFRTNTCTGYFEENRRFYPPLSLQCPLPKDEKLPTFSSNLDRNEECENIIDRIPRCTTRGNEYLKKLPDTVVGFCKNYITAQVNYNACVAKHFGDTSFPGNEYRLYLNKFGPLWRPTHDTINLYDENNLVVDTISY